MTTFFRSLARTSHTVSKYSGDMAALQSGGIPQLVRRIVRRNLTRRAYSIGRRVL